MPSGIGNNAFLIAIIAPLLIATRGHMAEASSKILRSRSISRTPKPNRRPVSWNLYLLTN